MKYSKKELKHQCDNCCCVDCHQTKKEKLECRRLRGIKHCDNIKAESIYTSPKNEKMYITCNDWFDVISYCLQKYKEKINEESKN